MLSGWYISLISSPTNPRDLDHMYAHMHKYCAVVILLSCRYATCDVKWPCELWNCMKITSLDPELPLGKVEYPSSLDAGLGTTGAKEVPYLPSKTMTEVPMGSASKASKLAAHHAEPSCRVIRYCWSELFIVYLMRLKNNVYAGRGYILLQLGHVVNTRAYVQNRK